MNSSLPRSVNPNPRGWVALLCSLRHLLLHVSLPNGSQESSNLHPRVHAILLGIIPCYPSPHNDCTTSHTIHHSQGRCCKSHTPRKSCSAKHCYLTPLGYYPHSGTCSPSNCSWSSTASLSVPCCTCYCPHRIPWMLHR